MVWGGFWAGEQGLMSNGSAAAAHKPPSLLHLSISTAVSNIQRFSNLSCIPDNIVEDLFLVSLRVFVTCPNPSLRALSMDGSPLRAEKSFCKKQGPNAGSTYSCREKILCFWGKKEKDTYVEKALTVNLGLLHKIFGSGKKDTHVEKRDTDVDKALMGNLGLSHAENIGCRQVDRACAAHVPGHR
jgi:hypothetical protein